MAILFEKDNGLNLEATELRLGLPGCDKSDSPCSRGNNNNNNNNKRALPIDTNEDPKSTNIPSLEAKNIERENAPPTKAQVVGWPPVRSYRKNSLQSAAKQSESGIYVKVSMDGAPYLRKMDLKLYKCYAELLKALEEMFKFKSGDYSQREGYNGSEFVPTYEDKDGDWMLLGDVPWEMFISSCKRLRIMKGSEARGLGCAV